MTLPTFAMSNSVVSRKRLAFLCTVMLIVFLAVFFSWSGRQGLFATSDSKTQTYTELYFISSHDIPERLTPGQSYSVPFAIANHEAADQDYTYQISLFEGGGRQVLQTKTVRLAAGQKSQQPLTFIPTATAASVRVDLLTKNQSIDFKVGQ